MAIVDTGLLTKGLRSEFFQQFEALPQHHQRLAMRIASNSDSETYKWLCSLPPMREWGTGRLARGLRSEGYSIENIKYEATIEADRDEISDDQTGQIRLRVGQMAQAAARHKDFLLAQLLIYGATAGYLAYDGKVFFAADHESGDSGEQSNLLTYNATDHTAVTSAEFKAALAKAVEAMLAYKNDVGEPVAVDTAGLVAVVPPQLYFAAREALNAATINNTSNVDVGLADLLAFPWLTSGVHWFLCKTNDVIKPFVFQDREPLEFGALAEKSELEFLREKYLYGVRARYRMAYGMWQMCVRTEFN